MLGLTQRGGMICAGFNTKGEKIGAGVNKRGRTVEGDERSSLTKYSYTKHFHSGIQSV